MKKLKISFPYQLLIALVLGISLGKLLPILDPLYNLLGSLFLNSINMIIMPLIFPTVVLAVVKIFEQKSLGKVLFKTFAYFFIVTTIIIFILMILGYYLKFGANLPKPSGNSTNGMSNQINIWSFIANIVPSNVIQAFASNSLLSVIFFAIALGLGLGAYGKEKSKPLLDILNVIVNAMYKITNFIIKLSPIGIFGLIAHETKGIKLSQFGSLIYFMIITYIAYIAIVLIIFPIISKIFGLKYIQSVKDIKDLLSLAFFSGSSSVVLPKLLERLRNTTKSKSIADFVLPLGYTFNLEGVSAFLALTVPFIANSYGIHLSFETIIIYILFLTLISKTVATIPSGSMVVLLATASQLGLPKEAITLLFAVDFFNNAGRTVVNVLGNAIAVKAIDHSESKRIAKEENK